MKHKTPAAFTAFLTLLLLAAGCSQNQSRPAASSASSSAAEVSASHGTTPDLTYQAPDGWVKEEPASSMRKAQYRLPRVEGDSEDAEMVVYHFNGGGGTVEANIKRWINQFSKPDGSSAKDSSYVDRERINGLSVTLVEVSGTYHQPLGPMMNKTVDKNRYRLLAAIFQTPGGPWFFKLTGPEKTVAHWRNSYTEFLNTVKLP